jgi:hypothetical protein
MNNAVTIEEMHVQILEMVVALDAIPPDQRTPRIQRLLDDLSRALEHYEEDSQ